MKFISALLALFLLNSAPTFAREATAVLAGGCFWCLEKDFEHVSGVVEVESGYAGGNSENPTYKTYESAAHLEVVRITYDPDIVSYAEILHTFWRSVNPTDAGGQFCDRGLGYSTAIFAQDNEQFEIAQKSKAELDSSGALPSPVVTPVREAATFWPAEDFHQDYYKKNPAKYRFYRFSCGRDRTIRALWGDEAHSGVNYE